MNPLNNIIPTMIEEHYNIDDSMELEQFNGWHFYKKFIEKKSLPLGWKDLSYDFSFFDFNYRFIMPETLAGNNGCIRYSNADRMLGVFRFSLGRDGNYILPQIPVDPEEALYRSIHPEQCLPQLQSVEDIIKKTSKPLVFEAFRIPQFGFEFFDVTDKDTDEISKLTNKDFALDIKYNQHKILEKKTSEVIGKIEAQPNFLLILLTILNKNGSLQEISKITNKIIHEE